MRPLSTCGCPPSEDVTGMAAADAVALPRFWRITFADLVALWGEEQARQMLAAMQRSFDGQEPEAGWVYASHDPRDLE